MKLTEQTYDVVIVGGGIVGAGIARDAAMRGLQTLLVEQYDFAFGTSSRSSRLLHGGLRYLAQGRVKMVMEASREKATLTRIAPHLSQPLPFLFPTRKGTQFPKWKLQIGVKLYDKMTRHKQFAGSSAFSREEVLARLPGLDPTDLTGAVFYYDALTNDARLVFDTLHSAAAHRAELRNYTRFVKADRDGSLWRCHLLSTTGEAREVRCKAIVNATGPWGDKLEHSRVDLRPTKGIHLVVDRARLPLDQAVVLTDANRILFLLPWGKRLILGTTDTDYAGPLETPDVTEDDMAYVLGAVNQAFPALRLIPDDVLAVWSGLRPLVADPDGQPSDISRDHQIIQSSPGWWDVTGGKLTTYRLIAEQTIDQLVSACKWKTPACRTAEEPLMTDTAFSGILPPELSADAVAWYCRNEWVRHLDDVMLRRSSWHYYLQDASFAAIRVAGWMAPLLGWTEDQRTAEIIRYSRIVAQPPWYEA